MPLFIRHYSRRAAGLATLLGLGCLCLSIGCLSTGGSADGNGTQSFEGTVSVPANAEVEVVYPAPFATPPNLTIFAWHNDWEIKQQTEKSFRVRNKSGDRSRSVEWKVRGVRVMVLPKTPQYRITPNSPPPAPVVEQKSPEANPAPAPTVQLGQPK